MFRVEQITTKNKCYDVEAETKDEAKFAVAFLKGVSLTSERTIVNYVITEVNNGQTN